MIHLRCAPPAVAPTDVHVGIELADTLDRALAAIPEVRRWVAVVDQRLPDLHPTRTRCPDQSFLVAGQESGKTFAALERLLRAFAHADVDRSCGIVAIGGGVVGDLAGLAASLYARGLPLVLVPTTLLAMVDAAVGGKTAVDLPEGKNLVGTFHPARTVLIDLGFLTTLPDTEYRSGLGEVLKVGIGLSPELWRTLHDRRTALLARDPVALAIAVEQALRAKIRVVETDLREAGPRRLLNLGHTLAHALEADSGWALPHGLAVARGLHFALHVAEREGMLRAADAAAARALLDAYGFTADPLPPVDRLAPYLRRDKKGAGDGVRFVAPTAPGAATILDLAWPRLFELLASERAVTT